MISQFNVTEQTIRFKLNLLVQPKISRNDKTAQRTQHRGAQMVIASSKRCFISIKQWVTNARTNHKLKIDTLLFLSRFRSLTLSFYFVLDFPLYCLFIKCSIIDGSHSVFQQIVIVTLIPYNMKYDSELPDGKVIMSFEFNNSSIQNGQEYQQQSSSNRNNNRIVLLERNAIRRRSNRTGKFNRRLRVCTETKKFSLVFYIVIVQFNSRRRPSIQFKSMEMHMHGLLIELHNFYSFAASFTIHYAVFRKQPDPIE